MNFVDSYISQNVVFHVAIMPGCCGANPTAFYLAFMTSACTISNLYLMSSPSSSDSPPNPAAISSDSLLAMIICRMFGPLGGVLKPLAVSCYYSFSVTWIDTKSMYSSNMALSSSGGKVRFVLETMASKYWNI